MVAQNEFQELFYDLLASYNRKPTMLLEATWYDWLKNNSKKEIAILFRQIVKKYKFLPAIAEILEENNEKKTLHAWNEMIKASGRIESKYSSTHHQSKELIINQLPELAQSFLRLTGKDLYQIGLLNCDMRLPTLQKEFDKFAKTHQQQDSHQLKLNQNNDAN